VVQTIDQLDNGLKEGADLLILAQQEQDPQLLDSVNKDLENLEHKLSQLEFCPHVFRRNGHASCLFRCAIRFRWN
jgi:hypothetical protein